jgi:uncharacterized membrane protein YsdA (DUF1294 family)
VLIVLTGVVIIFAIFMLIVFVVDKMNIKSGWPTIVLLLFISILLGGIFTAFIWNKMRFKGNVQTGDVMGNGRNSTLRN